MAGREGPDLTLEAVRPRRLDGGLGQVPQDPRVVVVPDRQRAGPVLAGVGRAPRLHRVGQLPGASHGLADPAHALGVAVDDRDRAEVVQRSLGGHRSRVSPLARGRLVLRQRRVPLVDQQDHVDVLGGGRAARTGRVGVVEEHTMLASRTSPEQVGDVSAAGALDVVRVDRPAGDRGHRVLELAGLVQPVGVQADRDVVRLGHAERRVDDLGPTRPSPRGPSSPPHPPRSRAPRARGDVRARALACNPRLTGSRSNASKVRSHGHGGSSNPAVISVVTPADSATGTSRR